MKQEQDKTQTATLTEPGGGFRFVGSEDVLKSVKARLEQQGVGSWDFRIPEPREYQDLIESLTRSLKAERIMLFIDNLEETMAVPWEFLAHSTDFPRPTLITTRLADRVVFNIKLTTEEYEALEPLRPTLTPHYLAEAINPVLCAIAEIQRTIDATQGKSHRAVFIKLIMQQSPISVSLDGASQAVQVVADTVVSWRRQHAKEMARLSVLEKEVQIESRKAEILEKRARAARERAEGEKLAAEATKQREEAERMRLENEQLGLELHRAKIQLALDVLAQVAPGTSETEVIAYVVKLLPPIETLVSSELEISID